MEAFLQKLPLGMGYLEMFTYDAVKLIKVGFDLIFYCLIRALVVVCVLHEEYQMT
jgi:hypothetical protein